MENNQDATSIIVYATALFFKSMSLKW